MKACCTPKFLLSWNSTFEGLLAVQLPPRRYPLDDGVVAADQGAKALAWMRRSRPRRRAGETRSEELLARTFGVQRQEYGVQ